MPADYLELRRAVERIAAHNDLGKQPLAFTISAGSMAATLAEQRGLCKPDQCDFFAMLDPFRRYGKDWDEIMRQAYSTGDIEAWSTSSGTVIVSRASFRTYGPRRGWLACTVAHELAHIRRNHVFQHSYYYNNTLRNTQEKRREELSYARSREQELQADRDSAVMLQRAGLPGRACLDNLIYLHHSSGDGSATESESSHPGYDERIVALRSFYASQRSAPGPQRSHQRPLPHGPSRPGTPGSVRYDRQDNLLVFTPERQ